MLLSWITKFCIRSPLIEPVIFNLLNFKQNFCKYFNLQKYINIRWFGNILIIIDMF